MFKLFTIFLLCTSGLTAGPPDSTTILTPIGDILDGATSVSVIPTGDIYITESNKHRLLVLNNTGLRIDSVGSQGRSNYRFDSPVSVNATNGLKIYVADMNNSRVQMFDRRHQYLTSITSDNIERQTRFKPAGLTVSTSNDLIVYDPDRFLVYKFDSNGNYSREINLRQFRIRDLTQMKIAGSVLMLLDSRDGVLHRFHTDGNYINYLAGFDNVRAIAGTDEHIWALYTDRVEKLSHRGASLGSFFFNQPLNNLTDLSVMGTRVYILTSNQLYTAFVE